MTYYTPFILIIKVSIFTYNDPENNPIGQQLIKISLPTQQIKNVNVYTIFEKVSSGNIIYKKLLNGIIE